MWSPIEKITFWIMVGVGIWAVYLSITTWAPPADPHVHSVEIPADNRTLLDDLPDLSCTGLIDELILFNPRLDPATAETVADAILTTDDVLSLNHRDRYVLMNIETRWTMETETRWERNDWRCIE